MNIQGRKAGPMTIYALFYSDSGKRCHLTLFCCSQTLMPIYAKPYGRTMFQNITTPVLQQQDRPRITHRVAQRVLALAFRVKVKVVTSSFEITVRNHRLNKDLLQVVFYKPIRSARLCLSLYVRTFPQL